MILASIVKKKIKQMDTTIIGGIVAIITGIGSYLIGQEKTKRSIESITLVNVQKSVDVYRLLIEDLKGQVLEMVVKINDLEEKIDSLTEENHQLKEMLNKRQYE